MSYPEFIAVFTAFFTVFYKYYYAILNIDTSRGELIDKLNQYRYLEFYQHRLNKTLEKLDNILGKPSWSIGDIANNIMFHYGISILYVFFTYYIVWLISGVEIFSTISLFEINASIESRIFTFLGLGLAFFVVYFLEKREKEPSRLDLYKKIISGMGALIGIGIWLTMKEYPDAVGTTIALLLIGTVTTSYIYQKTLIKCMRTVGIFGFVNILSFVILGAIGYFNTKSFFNEITISIYFFLLILPMINSQFDFVSLSISRYFSKKIANDRSILLIFTHLLLDIFFAMFLLSILVNFLYNAIEQINGFLDIHTAIPAKNIFINAIKNPFSLDNILITAMVLTTLFPTLVHVLLAIITFILYASKISSWYVVKIQDTKENIEDKKMKLTVFLAFPSTIIALILTYSCLYLPYIYFIKWVGI